MALDRTANPFLGLEHVGVVVPDIRQAETFFEEAFGATVLFRAATPEGPSIPGEKMHPINGLAEGSAMRAVTMLRLGNSAQVELFEISHPGREDQPRFEDMGPQHFSVYCSDMEAAAERLEAAGATLLDGPVAGMGPEEGKGNASRFCRTPWGLLLEFAHMPSAMQYDPEATQTRWYPSR
ncbi:VOC family protein [Pseudooceanicola sp. CBS1P-1]|uniref:VOC domain-containing protein n=1 Tax=Pseudooceanicola albus TaxID=2692189 RepID=A0A6L7G059_9RHOB|nr:MULTISPECIES: VOC family protein [Pseudooceanicola]MBT9383616.1 VOC family protein [Pseudooceanicola endophyticus]MXN17471.1 hypothetical protein [Pseudooceanicola albus]